MTFALASAVTCLDGFSRLGQGVEERQGAPRSTGLFCGAHQVFGLLEGCTVQGGGGTRLRCPGWPRSGEPELIPCFGAAHGRRLPRGGHSEKGGQATPGWRRIDAFPLVRRRRAKRQIVHAYRRRRPFRVDGHGLRCLRADELTTGERGCLAAALSLARPAPTTRV
jgi:hypothetical protein